MYYLFTIHCFSRCESDVIKSLGGHKSPILNVVLCTCNCITDPRFLTFIIHFDPFFVFVRFAVIHSLFCKAKTFESNQITKT